MRGWCRDGVSEEDGISKWPGAVHSLFRNYAQSSKVSFKFTDLRAVSQGPINTKKGKATKLNQMIYCCGSVRLPGKTITLYIDALRPTFRSLVVRFRKSHL